MSEATDRAVTLRQFALLLDVSPSYVTQLKAEGRLVLNDAGRVLVAASRQRIADTADPAKDGVRARHAAARDAGQGVPAAAHHPGPGAASAPPPAADPVGNTYQASRAVKERYLALDAKRAYEVSIGKLVEVATVESALVDAASQCRVRLETLPAVLGPELAGIRDETAATHRIAEAIEHVLEDLSRHFMALSRREPK